MMLAFDIMQFSDDELKNMSTVQMQLLRTAQKKKNELADRLQNDLAMYKKLFHTNGMQNSNLYELKEQALISDFLHQVSVIREQLEYSLEINEPYPDPDEDTEQVGYIVDYSLNYTDRYAIVRAYYLAIEDPVERMTLYSRDDVARRYLGEYYSTLYNVLYMYSQ